MTESIVYLTQAQVAREYCDPRWDAVLSPDERDRAGRYLVDEPRQQFVVGRGLLRHVLGEALSVAPSTISFGVGVHGKPELAGALADTGLHFNVSHSHNIVLVGWSFDGPIGVDVEQIRAEAATESIARRYFAASEVDALFAFPEAERAEAFFRCWTRKEAYLKVHGSGLSFPLGDFAVSLCEENPTLLWHRHEAAETRRWQLLDVSAALQQAGYRASVIAAPGYRAEWVPPR